MKKRAAFNHLAVAAGFCVFSSLAAGQDAVTQPVASFFSSGEYLVEETYVADASVERGRRTAEYDESDTIVRYVATPRISLGVLRLGAEWERFGFGFSSGAPLPSTLQSISLVLGLDTQISDSILMRFEAQPGIYDTGFDHVSDDFNMPFLVGATYIYSPNLQFIVGVSVDIERKYPVIPAAGFRWQFARQWVANATLPTPQLEYEWNKNLTLYLGADVKETNYRVDDNFGDRQGKPELNHAVLTYSEVRTGTGLNWKIAPSVILTAEAGYQPYRSFDFYRTDVRYHQSGSAPYGMISLHGAF